MLDDSLAVMFLPHLFYPKNVFHVPPHEFNKWNCCWFICVLKSKEKKSLISAFVLLLLTLRPVVYPEA